MDNGLKYWLALSRLKRLERFPIGGLLARLGAPEGIFSESGPALEGFSADFARSVRAFKDWAWVDKELRAIDDSGARVATYSGAEYPPALKDIHDPPPLLYLKGPGYDYSAPAVAIIGTRRPTHYGLRMSEALAKELAAMGLTIVSGMARGCDMAAHKGALAAGGFTAAVLGTGVDVPYPPESVRLYEEIIEKGLVVSEMPMRSAPLPQNFPRRNRIISGLCAGVLVIEAPLRSGSLMTARLALDYNREVCALPGQVTSNKSAGTNRLIKDGAALIECATDVLDALSIPYSRKEEEEPVKKPQLNKEEVLIWKALGIDPLHIDNIIEETGLTVSKASALLLEMELKGLIKQEAGKRFLRSH